VLTTSVKPFVIRSRSVTYFSRAFPKSKQKC